MELSGYKLKLPDKHLKRAERVKEAMERNKWSQTALLSRAPRNLHGYRRWHPHSLYLRPVSAVSVILLYLVFLAVDGVRKIDAGRSKELKPCLRILATSQLDQIQVAFTGLAYPCLICAYLGQAAYLSKYPNDVSDAFYKSTHESLYWPMFVVAVLASIIASQAMVSATFAIVKQSMALGCFPGVRVIQHEGQVYCLLQGDHKDCKRLWNFGGRGDDCHLLSCHLNNVNEMADESSPHYALRSSRQLLRVALLVVGALQTKRHVRIRSRTEGLSCIPEQPRRQSRDLTGPRSRPALHRADPWDSVHPPPLPHQSPSHTLGSRALLCQVLPVNKVPAEERFSLRRVGPGDYKMYRCIVRYGYRDRRVGSEELEALLMEHLKSFVMRGRGGGRQVLGELSVRGRCLLAGA
ncbi:potassium transporter 5-like [Typha latifolia]|uniref:potassium transporter 5-like n=1 Tax=Typha latifolia TaxID=4733 RepID=UPI003C2D9AA7